MADSSSRSASVDRSEPGNPQGGPDHYLNPAYNIPARWSSFGHQVSEILSPGATSCVEVGIGSGADVQGGTTALPFRDAAFDLVAAFEVLEHLP